MNLNYATTEQTFFVARNRDGHNLLMWPLSTKNPKVTIERDLRNAGYSGYVHISRESHIVCTATGAVLTD